MDWAAQSGVILRIRRRAQGTVHAPALPVQTAAVTEAELGSEQQRLAQEVFTHSLPTQGHVLILALLGGVDAGPLGVVQDQGVGAAAVEGALGVHTRASRAALLLALVMVYALEQGAVEHVSAGAVAAEAGDVVHTDSVLTDLWAKALALVHVSVVEGSGSCGDVASAVRTQSLEIRCVWAWAGVVDAAPPPALPLGAAALLQGGVGGEDAADAALQEIKVTLPELPAASRGQCGARGGVWGEGSVYRGGG